MVTLCRETKLKRVVSSLLEIMAPYQFGFIEIDDYLML